jgi:predicted permease
MENLVFSLNATIPVFLLMVLGLVFRRLGLFGEEFAAKVNKFVFQVTLPVLLFGDLATVDFSQAWDTKFVLFCFFVTVFSIAAVAALSFVWKDKSIQGEFIQASYRSSAALLGIAFITNIYGNAGMAPMMILGSVPLYNIMAVVVLSFFQPDSHGLDQAVVKKTLRGIVTNPILLGIVAGLLWSALKIPMPTILQKTVTNLGGVSSPMGLMAMGATFDFKKALGKVKPSLVAAVIKLVGFCALFLPLAVWMGFRNEELVAILVMLGSATTVSSYVMARNMGHEGVLSSTTVMLTTLLSAFTLTFWLWLLRSLGYV